ncbi:hypothetical protein ACIRRA_42330 [Nocardia sp. NPDC101769]|uniref:hypothetical protein n=1 Tax=Nocardia sp. NPDC101769 TaxID=3364333 RepID=UPI003800B770
MIHQVRYICTNCSWGWHDTPYCPVPPRQPFRYTPGQVQTLGEIRALRAAGVLPKSLRDETRLRWWMLPLGFITLCVSAILISHLISWAI